MRSADALTPFHRIRASGLSLSQLGEVLGVSQPAVTQWFAGRTRPSRTAQLLAAYVLRDLESQATDLSAGLPGATPSRQDAATSTISPPPTLRHVRSAVGPRKPRQ